MLKVPVCGTHLKLSAGCPALHWLIGRHQPGRFHEDGVAGRFLSLSDGCTIMWDLGCHVGWYSSLFASSRTNPGVFLLDPDVDALSWARAHVAMNQPQARVFHLAKAILAGPGCDSWNEIATKNLGYPDLIKIDIEGSEFLALGQMRDLISVRRPKLFIELHGHLGLPDYLEQLWANVGWLKSIYEHVTLSDKDSGILHKMRSTERRLEWPNGILTACNS